MRRVRAMLDQCNGFLFPHASSFSSPISVQAADAARRRAGLARRAGCAARGHGAAGRCGGARRARRVRPARRLGPARHSARRPWRSARRRQHVRPGAAAGGCHRLACACAGARLFSWSVPCTGTGPGLWPCGRTEAAQAHVLCLLPACITVRTVSWCMPLLAASHIGRCCVGQHVDIHHSSHACCAARALENIDLPCFVCRHLVPCRRFWRPWHGMKPLPAACKPRNQPCS